MPFCSGDLFAFRGLRKMRRCQHLGRLSRTRVGLPRVTVKVHQHLQQLLVGNFSCCAWGWIWLDNVRHGYMAISFNLHGLFFHILIWGYLKELVLDCFWIVSGWVLLIGEVDRFHASSRDAMVVAWDRSHVEPWYLMSHLMVKKGEVQIWAKKCTKEQFWITTLVKKNQPCKTSCFCMISAMSWPEGSKRQAPGDMYKVF